MNRTRTEARRPLLARSSGLLATLVLVAIASGCSHAPKPKAGIPADSSRAGKTSSSGKHAPATAARPGAGAATNGTHNGATVSGATTGSSSTTSGVVPQVSAAEQERLERETKSAMEEAQKALDAIDSAKLDVESNRKYVIAKDFLVQAGEARTRREWERAQGLAQKARLLAAEIAAR